MNIAARSAVWQRKLHDETARSNIFGRMRTVGGKCFILLGLVGLRQSARPGIAGAPGRQLVKLSFYPEKGSPLTRFITACWRCGPRLFNDLGVWGVWHRGCFSLRQTKWRAIGALAGKELGQSSASAPFASAQKVDEKLPPSDPEFLDQRRNMQATSSCFSIAMQAIIKPTSQVSAITI